ncbi:beta strand repeat-containing protein, partial [Campylobacter armoricus]|uniref:beta strand repeat-containing protein n=1 Tax=Campylobacter armoricus TaxID=2505970 RepID=UPI0011162468
MNNFNLISSCKKLSKQILLSNIVASLLFSSTFALPSGGKFTHGTTGSININGNTMNINGNKVNSVIQWGGGFSINQGESVNFNGNNKNYLNIAHGTSKSTIDGLLNANGNNVFLINPNGVIITKNGTINANRFVASTSSMDNTAMQRFANMSNFDQGLSFSPVFKPQKAGNVVNMGNINANKVLLIGNKVDIQGGKLGNASSTTHLVGNNVYIDADSTNLNSTINVTAIQGGYIQRQMNKFANDNYNFGNYTNIQNTNYTETNGQTHNGSNNFKKVLTIGNMGNEKANATEWFYFAKGWNEDLGNTQNIDEFRLVGNVDFSRNEGKNYANYCIDGLGCASMIVSHSDAFTKTFDGQGYTLKNINIDTSSLSNKPEYVGIFGKIENATIKNINVDYMGGGVKSNSSSAGGFAGSADGTFSNISLNNIGNISSRSYAGGFAGEAEGTFSNISLNNIENISSSVSNLDDSYVGGFAGKAGGTYTNISLNHIGNISSSGRRLSYASGFAGYVSNGTFSNISLNNIGDISSDGSEINSYAGGFAGGARGTFSNISLNHIGDIISSNSSNDGTYSYAGGFVGRIINGFNATFTNISLNNISSISGSEYTGGFVGHTTYGTFTNISLNNISSISGSKYTGGFAGEAGGTFSNISLNNIGNISSGSSAGGFAGYVSFFGEGKTFTNISLNNIRNISGNAAGGFIGDASGGTFSNISLNNIRNISGYSTGGFAGGFAGGSFSNISLNNIGNINDGGYNNYAGGFAGGVSNFSTFKNIYIFFNPNMSISASGNYIGKFFGSKYGSNLTFDNVHIYHHKDDLANANNDKYYWGNSNDKIQIHAYNDNDKNQAYNQFKQQDNTIARPIVQLPNITPPSNPSNPPDLTDTNVKLDENDLH